MQTANYYIEIAKKNKHNIQNRVTEALPIIHRSLENYAKECENEMQGTIVLNFENGELRLCKKDEGLLLENLQKSQLQLQGIRYYDAEFVKALDVVIGVN